MTFLYKPMGALALWAVCAAAQAQVSVENAWVRATVPGQKSTGAFMTLRSASDARLVAAQSDAARAAEVHEMKMEGDVMRMREVQSVALPAGQTVELKPGGYHIMLLDLGRQIVEGETVPLTLVIETAGRRETLRVQAQARPLASAARPAAHKHGAH